MVIFIGKRLDADELSPENWPVILKSMKDIVGYFLTESDAIKALTEYRKGIENNA